MNGNDWWMDISRDWHFLISRLHRKSIFISSATKDRDNEAGLAVFIHICEGCWQGWVGWISEMVKEEGRQSKKKTNKKWISDPKNIGKQTN